ncbi:MAG: DUF2953 domain-containing protein [Lachnospiraceae bacterium]
MTILLFILKIFGIILLVILGIILLAAFAILFFPLRYKAWSDFREEGYPDVNVRGSFLFHILGLRFTYRDGRMDTIFRLLFFQKRLYSDSKKTSENTQTDHNNKNKDVSANRHKRKKGFLIWLTDMMKELQKEENKQAWSLCVRQIKYLCKHYGPRKMKGNLRFSLGDPAYTGVALGLVSMFPFVYTKDFQLHPDFQSESVYFRGNLSLSGRLRLIHLLRSFIRLFMNKTIRSFINKGGKSNVRK